MSNRLHLRCTQRCACLLTSGIALMLFALHVLADSGTTTSNGPQINLIITADSPRIRTKGEFQPIRGYLSRSATPLRSAAPGPGSAVLSDLARTPGYYRVYAWWPQNVQGAGQAEMVIRHLRGETSVVVDQRANGAQWNALGVYELGFGTGAEIEARAHRGALVIDAFRLEFMGHDLPELTIETTGLPVGQDRTPYHAAVTAVGTPPYRWSIASGELPSGLVLDEAAGEIRGTPNTVGHHEFTLEVVDAHGRRSARALSIDVVRSEQVSSSSTLSSTDERGVYARYP